MAECFDCQDERGIRAWTFSPEERRWSIGLPATVLLCYSCWNKRDNYEPPDPDGEEMFRDRAAESRDAMDAARRLK